MNKPGWRSCGPSRPQASWPWCGSNEARSGLDVADALAAGGVTVVEVTMTVPNAVALIEQLSAALPATVIVGAGTVVDAEDRRAP